MSDSYQAIYDATRSRISNGDVGSAIEGAIRNENIGFYFDRATQSIAEAGGEMQRPCYLLRPSLSIDGDKWCALYGENIQDGIAGFGDSASGAMHDFDNNYYKKLD
jgi:hypothetical protein